MKRPTLIAGLSFILIVLFFPFQNCSGGFNSGLQTISPTALPVANGPTGGTVAPIQPVLPKQIPVFVAQGHVGRTLISCDDGFSWIHDISDDDNIVCYERDECDHQNFSASGITYNDGLFFAVYGHGAPGTLRRSSDGVHWEVLGEGNSDGGVSYVNKILLVVSGNMRTSKDAGVTFQQNGSIPGYRIPRTHATSGSVILVTGDDADKLVSQDGGLTWSLPRLENVAWQRTLFVADNGKGLLVSVSSVHNGSSPTMAYAATSTDNGLNWKGKLLYSGGDDSDWSGMYFDGTQFVGWFNYKLWTSLNGVDWDSSAVNDGNALKGPIARGAMGTYVSFHGVYGNQKAYRSTDGKNWFALDAQHFKAGHPIGHVVSGYVDRSVCQ